MRRSKFVRSVTWFQFVDQNGHQTCLDARVVTSVWRSELLNRHVAIPRWLDPFEDQNGWTDMSRHSIGYTHWRSKWLNRHVATLQWLHVIPFRAWRRTLEVAPLLGTIWRCMVNFNPWPLYPFVGRALGALCSRDWIGPPICSGSFRREKDLLSLCGIEPWIVDPFSQSHHW